MRFPVPGRFSVKHTVFFGVAIFLAQQINGTTIVFSLLTLLYLLLFVTAFNTAGGLFYPSGAWIFFNGVLGALLGLTYKNLLREPGQSNLSSPNVTLGVYCAGMASIALAAYASRRLRPKRPLLAYVPSKDALGRLALACLVIGLGLGFFNFLLPYAVYTAVAQLNRFSEAAIVLGVFYEIQSSQGRRSVNWIVVAAAANALFGGLLGFTKEGMLVPLLAWVLPCVMLGYRFSRAQVIGIVLAGAFFTVYLTPYSQIARRESENITNMHENMEVAWRYLSDLPATRREYLESMNEDEFEQGPNLFDQPQGLFDRLQMIGIDDALITETNDVHQIGIAPTYISFLNLIPHYFYPNKPTQGFGNAYAREIGVLPQSDTSTGISFSPTADTFHQLKWYGVFFVLPGVVFLLFIISDSLAGDVRQAPWSLILIALFAHVAPEGVIEDQVHASVFAPLTVVVIWLISRFVLPVVTTFLLGHRSKIRVSTALSSGRQGPLLGIASAAGRHNARTEKTQPESR